MESINNRWQIVECRYEWVEMRGDEPKGGTWLSHYRDLGDGLALEFRLVQLNGKPVWSHLNPVTPALLAPAQGFKQADYYGE